MADALKLTEVARDKGFKERVDHFLVKKAQSVLSDASPDAVDLAFAKIIVKGEVIYIVKFSQMLVTVTAVADGLEAVDYKHTAAADSAIENAVNGQYSNFAKGYS